MREFGILTLSRYRKIFTVLADSVDTHAIHARQKVLVTSGDEYFREFGDVRTGWIQIQGKEPFNFSRNVNLGLSVLRGMDILLTNDDVSFMHVVTPLIDIVEANPHVGIVAPQVIGGVGNRLQSVLYNYNQKSDFIISKERLAFVCVYIRKEVIEKVGLFDDRTFDGYGSEDDDYCLRTHQAGFKLAITPKVVVKHGFDKYEYSSSFLQTMGQTERIRSMGEMRKRLVEKYT